MYYLALFWPEGGQTILIQAFRALTPPVHKGIIRPMNRLFSLRFTPCGAVILALVLLAFSALPGALAQEDIFTATVKGGTLRLRELPGDNGRVLGRYPTGTLITVLADGEEYCRVRTPDGREGYMMKAFLTFENGLPPTDPAAEAALLTPHSWVETTRQAALDRGIDPAKPMLALTFDDGPSPATEAILDQLKAHGALATFFVLGTNIAGNEEILKRAAREGHQLASHSWSHPNLNDISSSAVRSQMTRTMDKIEELTGQKVIMMRPPFGATNRLSRQVIAELGLPVILWGVDTLDWKTRNASKISQAILKGAGNGVIILCHDTLKSTGWALETALPELINRGYQLVTVAEMMSFREEELKPGWEYSHLDPEKIISLVP